MSQLIEFLMTLVGNKRFVDLMRQAVPRLIYITLGVSARHAPDTNQVLSDLVVSFNSLLDAGAVRNRLAHSVVPLCSCHRIILLGHRLCIQWELAQGRVACRLHAATQQTVSSQGDLPLLGAVCRADCRRLFHLSLSAVQAACIPWQGRS